MLRLKKGRGGHPPTLIMQPQEPELSLSGTVTPRKCVKKLFVKKLGPSKIYFGATFWPALLSFPVETLKKLQGLAQIIAFLIMLRECSRIQACRNS